MPETSRINVTTTMFGGSGSFWHSGQHQGTKRALKFLFRTFGSLADRHCLGLLYGEKLGEMSTKTLEAHLVSVLPRLIGESNCDSIRG